MLENGIFIFGMLLIEAMPLVVEMGVLLDLFVGIFVICIITNHINCSVLLHGHAPPGLAQGIIHGVCADICFRSSWPPSPRRSPRTVAGPWLLPADRHGPSAR